MADTAAHSVSGYSYLGCFVEHSESILTANVTIPVRNVPDYCCDWCLNINTENTFCGLRNGNKCYCDSKTRSSINSTSASACNSTCLGAGSLPCGGSTLLDLYSATPSVTIDSLPSMITPQIVPGYSYYGCFTDSTLRVLRGLWTSASFLDPEYCCEWCLNVDNNNQWCGVQAGPECWCDKTTYSPILASSEDCSYTCAGGSEYQCGGIWRMNLYHVTAAQPAATSGSLTLEIPAETSTSAQQPGSRGGQADFRAALSGGGIAGIVVGVVAVMALFSTLFFLLIRRRRARLDQRYSVAEQPPVEKMQMAEMHTLATTQELQAGPTVELGAVPGDERIHEMDANSPVIR